VASNADIQGIEQFDRALNEIQGELPKDLKEAAQQIAKEWIAAARNKATGQARGPAAAMSVGTDPEGATLVNDHPLFFGTEFGGQARPSTMHFPPYQGQRGYWLFPAARENVDKFQKLWDKAIDEATKSWDHKG
jgi:hypothetical protein